MAGPWGVLPVGPTATTTEVEEDVDSCNTPCYENPKESQ
jgi:hypothetical protein